VARKNLFAVEPGAGKAHGCRVCGSRSSQRFRDRSDKETSHMPVVFKAEQDGIACLYQGRRFCHGNPKRP
jgi:hypothetical protein